MNSQQVLHLSAQTRAYNRAFFCAFLEELFPMFAERGVTNVVLVMDNVPFHKGEQVRTLVESHGHKVLYLPPYSPFLNPIENMFSKWKEYVRRERPENEAHLLELINMAASTVSADDCSAFFRHTMAFIARCLGRQVITD